MPTLTGTAIDGVVNRRLRYHDKVVFYDTSRKGFVTELCRRHGEVGVHVPASDDSGQSATKRNPEYLTYLFEIVPFDEDHNPHHLTSREVLRNEVYTIPKEVCYGERVRLLHVHSQSYLCIRHLDSRVSSTWPGEADNIVLTFLEPSEMGGGTAQGSRLTHTPEAYWRVLPGFKVRQEGQVIESEDEVVFQHAEIRPTYYLHTSHVSHTGFADLEDLQLKPGEEYHEGNLSLNRTTYSIKSFETVYRDLAESDAALKNKMVKMGDAVLLFHKDLEAYINIKVGGGCEGYDSDVSYPLHRPAHLSGKMKDFRSNCFFIFENLETDQGGFVPYRRPIRIKHLASRLYLAHVLEGGECRLSMTRDITDTDDESTLWMLTTDIIRDDVKIVGVWEHQLRPPPDDRLLVGDVVRVAGVTMDSTQPGDAPPLTLRCWLGTSADTSRQSEQRSASVVLGCKAHQVFQDAVLVMLCPQQEMVHDVKKIVAARPILQQYILWWKQKDEEAHQVAQQDVHKLQKRVPKETMLAYVQHHLDTFAKFLSVVPGSGQRGFMGWEKLRMHQQTMLDQNIHVDLMDCISVPFGEAPWMPESSPRSKHRKGRGRFDHTRIEDPQYHSFKRLCVAAYSVLAGMAKGNSVVAVALAQENIIPRIQQHVLFHRIHADACLEELLKHEEVLRFVKDEVVKKFCDDLRTLSMMGEKDSARRLPGQSHVDGECAASRIITLLKMCCVCEATGNPIGVNQNIVAEHFIEDNTSHGYWPNGRCLLRHKIGQSGQVELIAADNIWLPVKNLTSADKERLIHDGMPASEYCDKVVGSPLMAYHVACIELFAALSKGRKEVGTARGRDREDRVLKSISSYFEHDKAPALIAVRAMIETQKGGSGGPGKAMVMCPAYAALVRDWLLDTAPLRSLVLYEEKEGGRLLSVQGHKERSKKKHNGSVHDSWGLPKEQEREIKAWVKGRCTDLSFLMQGNQSVRLLLAALTLCKQLVRHGYYTDNGLYSDWLLGAVKGSGKGAKEGLAHSLLNVLDPSTDGKDHSEVLTKEARRRYCDANVPLFQAKLEVCQIFHSVIDDRIWNVFLPSMLGVEDREVLVHMPFWAAMNLRAQLAAQRGRGIGYRFFNEQDIMAQATWLRRDKQTDLTMHPFDWCGDPWPPPPKGTTDIGDDALQSTRGLLSHLMEMLLYESEPLVHASLDLIFRMNSMPLEVLKALDRVVILEHKDERTAYKEVLDLSNTVKDKANDFSIVDSNPGSMAVVEASIARLASMCVAGAEDVAVPWDKIRSTPANAQAQRLVSHTKVVDDVLDILNLFLRWEEQQSSNCNPHEEITPDARRLLRMCYRFLTAFVKGNPTVKNETKLLNWCCSDRIRLHLGKERKLLDGGSEIIPQGYDARLLQWDLTFFLSELCEDNWEVCNYFANHDLVWIVVNQLNPKDNVEGSGRAPKHLQLLTNMVYVTQKEYVEVEGYDRKVLTTRGRVIDSSLTTVLSYLLIEKKRVLMLLRDSNEQEREVKERILTAECNELMLLNRNADDPPPPLAHDGPLKYHLELVHLFAKALRGNTAVMSHELAFSVLWPLSIPNPPTYPYPLFYMLPYCELLSEYLLREDRANQLLMYMGQKTSYAAGGIPMVWWITKLFAVLAGILNDSVKPGNEYLHRCFPAGAGSKTYKLLGMKWSGTTTGMPTSYNPPHWPVWFNRRELEEFVINGVVPFLHAISLRTQNHTRQEFEVVLLCQCATELTAWVTTPGFSRLQDVQRAQVRQLLQAWVDEGLSYSRVKDSDAARPDMIELCDAFNNKLRKALRTATETLLEPKQEGTLFTATGTAAAFAKFKEGFLNSIAFTHGGKTGQLPSRARMLAFAKRTSNNIGEYLLREYLVAQGEKPDANEDHKHIGNPTMLTNDTFSTFADLLVSPTVPTDMVADVLRVLAFGFAEDRKVAYLEEKRQREQGADADAAREALDLIDKRKREVQQLFNRKRATQKIFSLMEMEIPDNPYETRQIQSAAINLLKQLLDGGDRKQVQQAIYKFFIERRTEGFFVFCREQLKLFEEETKHWDLSNVTQEELDRLEEMEVFLRVLQLLCEGHMTLLQNYLREQNDNSFSVNVVREVALFVRYLTKEVQCKALLRLVQQGFSTLTEFCQGPCKGNQEVLVDVKMPSVVGDLLMAEQAMALAAEDDDENDDKEDDGAPSIDSVLSEAISMLLSLTEGVSSSIQGQKSTVDVPRKLLDMLSDNNRANLYNLFNKMNESWIRGYIAHINKIQGMAWQSLGGMHNEPTPEDEAGGEELLLGFNIFIFILSLCRFDKQKLHSDDVSESEVFKLLRSQMSYEYFNGHVGQIEIGRDGQLEKVYFVLPDRCRLLPEESKMAIQVDVKRDSRETKVQDFFSRWGDLLQEINIYDEAHKQTFLRLFIDYGTWLQDISLFLSLVISGYLLCTMKRQYPSSKEYLSDETYIGFNVLAFVQIFTEMWLFFGWMQLKGRVFIFKHVQKSKNEVEKMKKAGTQALSKEMTSYQEYADWGKRSTFKKVYLSLFVLLRHRDFYITTLFAAAAPIGYFGNPIFFSLQIFRVIERSDSLQNVIKSVTSKYQDLLWTAGLGMVVVFLFSMVSFYYFADKYYDVKRNPDLGVGFTCQELWRCFVLNVVYGLRQGGGLADVLQHPDWHDTRKVWSRLAFDFLFWLVMIIIFLNIIFGIILDTFAELRDKKQDRERDMKSRCFICGKEAYEFDKSRHSDFVTHYHKDHNMWNYLFFYVYLYLKSPEQYTGQESWVSYKIERNLTDFFPEDALALEEDTDDEEAEEEERERRIEQKIDSLLDLVSSQRHARGVGGAPGGGGRDLSRSWRGAPSEELKRRLEAVEASLSPSSIRRIMTAVHSPTAESDEKRDRMLQDLLETAQRTLQELQKSPPPPSPAQPSLPHVPPPQPSPHPLSPIRSRPTPSPTSPSPTTSVPAYPVSEPRYDDELVQGVATSSQRPALPYQPGAMRSRQGASSSTPYTSEWRPSPRRRQGRQDM